MAGQVEVGRCIGSDLGGSMRGLAAGESGHCLLRQECILFIFGRLFAAQGLVLAGRFWDSFLLVLRLLCYLRFGSNLLCLFQVIYLWVFGASRDLWW